VRRRGLRNEAACPGRNRTGARGLGNRSIDSRGVHQGAPTRRENQPTNAPSSNPASGARGTSVVTLTRIPSARPTAAPTTVNQVRLRPLLAPSAIAGPILAPIRLRVLAVLGRPHAASTPHSVAASIRASGAGTNSIRREASSPRAAGRLWSAESNQRTRQNECPALRRSPLDRIAPSSERIPAA
jgi:hypothetical protein